MVEADPGKLYRAGRVDEAMALCCAMIRSNPSCAVALHLAGRMELERGSTISALDFLSRAVAAEPDVATYRIDLAAALGRSKRAAEAIPHLCHAVMLRPDAPELFYNLGCALRVLQRPTAHAAFRTAVALRPQWADANLKLGDALREAGSPNQAVAAYRRVIELEPTLSPAFEGLSAAESELGDCVAALAARRRHCQLAPGDAGRRSAMVYEMHYSDKCDAAMIAGEHREWGRIFCEPLRRHARSHDNRRDPDRRLRIGYVSPDLREHTVTKFISSAILYHDRERFGPFCYSDVESPDHVTGRLKSVAEQWRESRKLDDAALDQVIRQDGIDILVDLRGHAAGNRLTLFARKPVPVQVNMVGYFNTTGLAAMDYRITDQRMDPPGQTEHLNTETLIRICPSCWCYTPEPDAPDVSDPPVLANGHVTFGSLNKIVKVSERCAKLWVRVLESVPGSRLVVSATGDAATVVRDRLGSFGVPADRLDVLDKVRTSGEYLERFHQIDIALDTWPFNGITTTCDGLWMGVPCVSTTGQTSVSRAGKSILHAAGLGELATETPEAFVAVARTLARDVDRLAEMRRSMRERLLGSPLMDHRGFAQKLETAYRQMWRAWCASPPGRKTHGLPHNC